MKKHIIHITSLFFGLAPFSLQAMDHTFNHYKALLEVDIHNPVPALQKIYNQKTTTQLKQEVTTTKNHVQHQRNSLKQDLHHRNQSWFGNLHAPRLKKAALWGGLCLASGFFSLQTYNHIKRGKKHFKYKNESLSYKIPVIKPTTTMEHASGGLSIGCGLLACINGYQGMTYKKHLKNKIAFFTKVHNKCALLVHKLS